MIPPLPLDDTTTLVLRRTFTASRQRVFRAWIEPAALEYWFRPNGMSMIVSELDARVGGSFCFDLENGSTIRGTYLHIAPPEKLVFTWSSAATYDKATVVTVEFLEKGLGTQVVLTHERFSNKEMYLLHQAGWQALLDQLEISLLYHP